MILPIHERMAELWTVQRGRKLTEPEEVEMVHCLKANANYVAKLSGLYNMSYLAYELDDTDWLYAICKEIDQVEDHYIQIKKPSHKDSTK